MSVFTIMNLNILNRIKLGDVVVILITISLAVLLIFVFYTKNERYAIIEKNGEILYKIDLFDTKNENEIFIVKGKYTAEITVKNGQIFLLSSNCPDKICINSGKLPSDTNSIICLPNMMVIRLQNDTKKQSMDAISR